MNLFQRHFLLSIFFFGVILFPMEASAQLGAAGAAIKKATNPTGFLGFGGKVVMTLPCTNGGVYFTIIPAKVGPTALIWTPASLTFSYGPPSHSGQSTLGLSGPPTVCFVGKVPFFGASVITIGTSAI